jgi:hypothetical protein
MVAVKAQDVMDNLLSCEAVESFPAAEKLDYLIYRDPDKLSTEPPGENQCDQIWTASQDKVTVQIWESRANIRVRVSQKTHPDLCMKGIADIAVQAIIEELRRDTK